MKLTKLILFANFAFVFFSCINKESKDELETISNAIGVEFSAEQVGIEENSEEVVIELAESKKILAGQFKKESEAMIIAHRYHSMRSDKYAPDSKKIKVIFKNKGVDEDFTFSIEEMAEIDDYLQKSDDIIELLKSEKYEEVYLKFSPELIEKMNLSNQDSSEFVATNIAVFDDYGKINDYKLVALVPYSKASKNCMILGFILHCEKKDLEFSLAYSRSDNSDSLESFNYSW